MQHNLAVLFGRMFGNWSDSSSYTQLDRPDSLNYWEANIAGAPRFRTDRADSVSHVIASFAELYGSSDGALLRRWCAKYGWPIVWALGPNGGADFWAESTETSKGKTFLANERVLDVSEREVFALRGGAAALSKAHDGKGGLPAGRNISATDLTQAAAAHGKAWNETAKGRARGLGVANTSWVARRWKELRASSPRSTWLTPLSAATCQAPTSCVGTDPDGHCVCVRGV